MVEEFIPVLQLCCLILAVYEDDLCNPTCPPPGGYIINPDWVVLQKKNDIVLAIRGLNLAKEGDYAVLLDNKLGQTKFDGGYVHNGFDGGYVHNGLLKAATCKVESGQVGEQNQMLCYCMCMSLNLADVINSVVAARHDSCRWWWCRWLGMRDGGRQLWIVNGCEKKGKRKRKQCGAANLSLVFCLSQNGVV
ncbi:hypothetical protein WN944_009152 [Citrus x changshan-huyou]|uniref:Uncharacterized protein n=1 Tax=Citrus x changshan-huyou TaxID=2935761 RepID=A0AAP0MSH6_9ROSI